MLNLGGNEYPCEVGCLFQLHTVEQLVTLGTPVLSLWRVRKHEFAHSFYDRVKYKVYCQPKHKRIIKMDEQTYVASEPMKKFFNNLLSLKQFVREELKKDEAQKGEQNPVLIEIIERLDACIKEGK